MFFAVSLAFLHACKDQPTGPDGAISAAKGSSGKYTLTLNGNGSTANGTLTSSRGGLKCSIQYLNGQVSTSGSCSTTPVMRPWMRGRGVIRGGRYVRPPSIARNELT